MILLVSVCINRHWLNSLAFNLAVKSSNQLVTRYYVMTY